MSDNTELVRLRHPAGETWVSLADVVRLLQHIGGGHTAMEQRPLTTREAADYLRCSEVHLRRLVAAGVMPCNTGARNHTFLISDLDEYLRRQTTVKERV